MNRKRLWTSIVIFVAIVGSVFAYDIVRSRTPVLGLDLQGGLSVIYAAKDPAEQSDLVLVRDQMREQLEAFGIAEPDVRLEGANIVADLPGVNDQEAAKDALDVSGIVTLRPVLQCQPVIPQPEVITGSTLTDGTVTANTIPDAIPGATVSLDSSPAGTTPGISTPDGSTPDGSTEISTASSAEVSATPQGFRSPAAAGTTPSTPSEPVTNPIETVPVGTSVEPTNPIDSPDIAITSTPPPVTLAPGAIVSGTTTTTLPPPNPISDGTDVLFTASEDAKEQCAVGPPGGSGDVFAKRGANAEIDQQTGGWIVVADLKREGEASWNALAQQCFSGASTCPSRRLAIVLDDVIQSAPTVNDPNFTGSVRITGDFTQDEAEKLAGVINRGAYPVEVVVERTETVSPTAGQDSLQAAILAGLIGIAIMLAFMVAYYRLLSIIMIVGLSIWGVTVYTLATYVSQATNYALTLAGATGIIIAVGVTVDTYVVFFERIRDERRAGRTFANAAPRSYRVTGRTVLSADVVSLIASLILFSLSVGSVQGFALYLGLTTVCDLLVFYFFTRPAVLLLSQTKWGRSSGITKAVAGASA